MNIAVSQPVFTPELLLTLPEGERFELVNGKLVERHMGYESSWIGGEIYRHLSNHCQTNDLGWVAPADASFQCFPDASQKVRRPDVSFIRRGRLPGERLPEGHVRIPPDLAVEVVSPNELYDEVDEKLEDYLRAGVRTVWVVSPRTRSVQVYRADGSVSRLRENDDLTGDDALAGFRCRVGDVFPPPAPAFSAPSA